MKVKSVKEAWRKAGVIFPTDYVKDEVKSERAGYPIYYSTASGVHAWISDLGNRLEVNFEDGRTVNIWIEEDPKFSEYQLEEALKVVSEAIYYIDDLVGDKLQKATGIDEARSVLYGAYGKIAEILKAQHPDSKLFKMYNLHEA